MSIRTKLLSSATLGAVLLSILGWASLFFLDRVTQLSIDLFESEAHLLELNELDKNTSATLLYLTQHVAAQEPDLMETLQAQIVAVQETVSTAIAEDKHANELNEFQIKWEQFIALIPEIVALSSDYSKEEAFALIFEQALPLHAETLATIQTQLDFQRDDALAIRNNVNSTQTQARSTIIISTIALTVALLIGGFWIARLIHNRLRTVIARLQDIAEGEGDLTKRLDTQANDEISELSKWFNRFVDKLQETISQLQQIAYKIEQDSKHIMSSSKSLTEMATKEASAIEEISASMKGVSAQSSQNAEKSNEANQLVFNAKNNAQNGDQQMAYMSEAMHEINQTSNNISKIIKVIDEIAFQTNLLALNASVEAARAGLHGKGFAVVASEVRDLATRSTNAARETASMIENAVEKIQKGIDFTTKTANSLSEIVSEINSAAEIVDGINTASKEQSDSILQIDLGIQQIDQATQNNAIIAEQNAGTAQKLTGAVSQLQSLLNQFKTNINTVGQIENTSVPELTDGT